MAGKKIVEIPSSKMKLAITKILCEKGYILSYKVVEGEPFNTIKIALKYHPQTKTAAIKKTGTADSRQMPLPPEVPTTDAVITKSRSNGKCTRSGTRTRTP